MRRLEPAEPAPHYCKLFLSLRGRPFNYSKLLVVTALSCGSVCHAPPHPEHPTPPHPVPSYPTTASRHSPSPCRDGASCKVRYRQRWLKPPGDTGRLSTSANRKLELDLFRRFSHKEYMTADDLKAFLETEQGVRESRSAYTVRKSRKISTVSYD